MKANFEVWFMGSPTDCWHRWALRDNEISAGDLAEYLCEIKGAYDACYTQAGVHPNDA